MLRLLNIPFLDTRVIGMVKKSMLLHIRVEAKSNSICRGNIIDPDALTQLGQRHIPDAEGCAGSVDNGIFIHAIVPRHVETVVLLSREAAAAGLN